MSLKSAQFRISNVSQTIFGMCDAQVGGGGGGGDLQGRIHWEQDIGSEAAPLCKYIRCVERATREAADRPERSTRCLQTARREGVTSRDERLFEAVSLETVNTQPEIY